MSEQTTEKRVRFPRLERGAFMWGLDGYQFLIVMGGVFSVIGVQMLFGPPAALRWLLIAGPVIAFGAISWRGRTLLSRTRVWGEHKVRRFFGMTRWHADERPVPQGTLALPGKVGARITVHSTKWAHGAMVHDAGRQTVSALIRCEAVGWPLADDDDRNQRADAFSDLCRGLIRKPTIERVAVMARTIMEQRTSAIEWQHGIERERSVDDPWGAGVMAEVLDGDKFVDGAGQLLGPESQVLPVHRDSIVVVTMSIPKAAKSIKAAGGGLAGAAQVLASEVRAMSEDLSRCGVTESTWLSAAEVGDVVRVAMDPSATEVLQRQATDGRDPDVFDHGRALLVDDGDPNFLLTGGGAHATYWIGQWPQTMVAPGFLSSLIGEGQYPHTVTVVFTAEPAGSGLAAIERRRMSLESKKDMNARLKRPTSILDVKAEEDLNEREEELAMGHVNIRTVGYVSVSGMDPDELMLNQQMMERDASRLDLQLLKGQQWSAFVAAALPLGWGMSR